MWTQSKCDANDQCRSWTVDSNQCCLYEAVACPTQKPTYASGAKVAANITCGCSSFCSADGLHCLGGSMPTEPTIPLLCSLSTNIAGIWGGENYVSVHIVQAPQSCDVVAYAPGQPWVMNGSVHGNYITLYNDTVSLFGNLMQQVSPTHAPNTITWADGTQWHQEQQETSGVSCTREITQCVDIPPEPEPEPNPQLDVPQL